MGVASPFFRSLARQLSIKWMHGESAYAHPLDSGHAAIATSSLDETANALGVDGGRYRALISPLVRQLNEVVGLTMTQSVRSLPEIRAACSFAIRGLGSADQLARLFRTEPAKALLAGCAGHSILPLSKLMTAGMAVLFAATAHGHGWPIIQGGSQNLADDLVRMIEGSGGKFRYDWRVKDLAELPSHRVAVFDTNPAQVARIAGAALRARERRALLSYRHGPGIFKIDYTLEESVPWINSACNNAVTLHLAGTASELASSEYQVARGVHPRKPFVLATQPTVVDATRAPPGRHTFSAYCHVPNGSTIDMTDRIEAQIGRFAPGFRDIVRTRHITNSRALQEYNPNCVGGDILGGAMDGLQMLFRPRVRRCSYNTSSKRIFLCSASTPPGAGVHGMGGFNAAQRVLMSSLR